MQSLEIDDDAIGRSDEGNETIPLTTTTNRNRRGRKAPFSLVSSLSSSSSPLRSRTTRERQCCAITLIVFGVFLSTSIVIKIGRNYHPPWYYYQGRPNVISLNDLLKNRPTNTTTTVSNATTVVQNNTQFPLDHSQVLPWIMRNLMS